MGQLRGDCSCGNDDEMVCESVRVAASDLTGVSLTSLARMYKIVEEASER